MEEPGAGDEFEGGVARSSQSPDAGCNGLSRFSGLSGFKGFSRSPGSCDGPEADVGGPLDLRRSRSRRSCSSRHARRRAGDHHHFGVCSTHASCRSGQDGAGAEHGPTRGSTHHRHRRGQPGRTPRLNQDHAVRHVAHSASSVVQPGVLPATHPPADMLLPLGAGQVDPVDDLADVAVLARADDLALRPAHRMTADYTIRPHHPGT